MQKICWLAFMVSACSDPITSSVGGDKNGDESQAESGAQAEDTAQELPPAEPEGLQSPTIRFASAVCLADSIWKLNLVAVDPQGNNTLKSEANCAVYPAGETTGEPVQALTLDCDAGTCNLDEYDGYPMSILCEDASNWSFHFQIMDEEGHESLVEVVTGSAETL